MHFVIILELTVMEEEAKIICTEANSSRLNSVFDEIWEVYESS